MVDGIEANVTTPINTLPEIEILKRIGDYGTIVCVIKIRNAIMDTVVGLKLTVERQYL